MEDHELLLLGLLRRRDMHGYQLAELIERNLGSCTDLKKSSAYFLLNRMAAAGWITHSEEQVGNRPPRRVYSITTQGEAAFHGGLRESLGAYSPTNFSGDAGLAFLDELPAEEATTLLRARRAAIERRRQALAAAPRHPGSLQLLIDHQVQHLAAELEWVDALLDRMKTTGGG